MNFRLFWIKSDIMQKIIYLLYLIAFIIATGTHTRDLINGGLFPYTAHPLWANIYWTILTIADPLAILILFISLRKGIFVYAVIIVTDVMINLYFTVSSAGMKGILNVFMLGQILFLIILITTWKKLSTFN